MQSLREDIEKEHSSIQESDVIVFFQVAQFVTSFQYHKFFTSKVRDTTCTLNFLLTHIASSRVSKCKLFTTILSYTGLKSFIRRNI